MTKKSIFFLIVFFLAAFSFSFAVSDVKAESVKMVTLDCGSQSNVTADFSTFLADDATSSEDISDEESDTEEVIAEEPDEGTEEIDEGDDGGMEEEVADEAPDYDDSEEGEE